MTASTRPISELDPISPVEELVASLIETGALSAIAVDRARRASDLSIDRIDRVLLKLGLVDERVVCEGWAKHFDVSVFRAEDLPEQAVLPEVLPPRFLRNACLLPIGVTDGSIRIAAIDPLDQFSLAAVAVRTGRRIEVVVTSMSDFTAAFARLYPDYDQPKDKDADLASGEVIAGDMTRLRDLATDAPIIRLVDSMVERGVELGASDIHLTTSRSGARLRYRIDGVLRDVPPHPADAHAAVISRIKVLADLDIAERRLPQDGRIRYAVRGREIDLRIATMPHLDGEGAVLRILDRAAVRLDLPSLGLSPKIEEPLSRLLTEPHGILLVTGPTGSGKTTTLYAALRQLVRPERNVISVEDPVEYHLDGVAQIQVQKKIGLDFPTVLRSVLRQDPDVIMIGEVRDAETAAIANQAALTGHFVLATLHTNSAAASLPRLLDMGLEPYLLATTVRGVLSQRLLRTLCPHCAQPLTEADSGVVARLERLAGDKGTPPDTTKMRRAVGCPRCSNTGYSGRVAIAELLLVDDDIRQGILDQRDADHLEALARCRGFEPLTYAGLDAIRAGKTTFEELFRVTGERSTG